MEHKGTQTILINGVLQEVEFSIHPYQKSNRSGKGIIFVDVANETVAENLMNRRNRPIAEYRKIALQVLTNLEMDFTKIDWSQYAGCTCACSPGFVIQGNNSLRNHALWIKVTKSKELLNNGEITPLENYLPSLVRA